MPPSPTTFDLGLSDAARQVELGTKLERLRAELQRRGAAAIHLQRRENLSWISCGGEPLIYREGAPVFEAVVTETEMVVISDRIEAARITAEELPAGVRVLAAEWFEPRGKADLVAQFSADGLLLSDAKVDLAEVRQPLLDVEIARLAVVGQLASQALSDVVSSLNPQLSERQAAALIHGALRSSGAELPVLLIAGESRLGHVRHPLPTDAKLGGVAMVVVCASVHGVIASLTRQISFGAPPKIVLENLDRVWWVEAAMLRASTIGTPSHVVFEAAQRAYSEVGAADAWRDHHQGGPACYHPRSWLATPSEVRRLRANMPLAWNPSLPWAKSEDTYVLQADGSLTNLTLDPSWPSVVRDGRPRATVLELP